MTGTLRTGQAVLAGYRVQVRMGAGSESSAVSSGASQYLSAV